MRKLMRIDEKIKIDDLINEYYESKNHQTKIAYLQEFINNLLAMTEILLTKIRYL